MLTVDNRTLRKIGIFAGLGIGLLAGVSAWMVTVEVVPVVVGEVLKVVLPLMS